MIPDPSLSINEGAITVPGWQSCADKTSFTNAILQALCREYDFDLDTPFQDYPKKVHDVLIYGTNGKEVKVYYKGQRGEGVYDVAFDGLIKNVERRYRETGSETMKAEYETFMNITPCSACGGQRLKASALAVTIGEKKYFRGHSPFYREASEISSGTAFDGDAADDRWSDPERDPCKDSVSDGCRTGLSDAGEGNRNFVGG